jgi:hypothetical protein
VSVATELGTSSKLVTAGPEVGLHWHSLVFVVPHACACSCFPFLLSWPEALGVLGHYNKRAAFVRVVSNLDLGTIYHVLTLQSIAVLTHPAPNRKA